MQQQQMTDCHRINIVFEIRKKPLEKVLFNLALLFVVLMLKYLLS